MISRRVNVEALMPSNADATRCRIDLSPAGRCHRSPRNRRGDGQPMDAWDRTARGFLIHPLRSGSSIGPCLAAVGSRGNRSAQEHRAGARISPGHRWPCRG
jgi:hypothetical protein